MKLSTDNEHLIFIGTLFQILVRNIFGKGLRYLFLINSNLKPCVLLGSTNGANIPLKDEGSFSFIYLYIKVEALCLCISDNLSIPSLENKGSVCCEYPLSDKVRIAFF